MKFQDQLNSADSGSVFHGCLVQEYATASQGVCPWAHISQSSGVHLSHYHFVCTLHVWVWDRASLGWGTYPPAVLQNVISLVYFRCFGNIHVGLWHSHSSLHCLQVVYLISTQLILSQQVRLTVLFERDLRYVSQSVFQAGCLAEFSGIQVQLLRWTSFSPLPLDSTYSSKLRHPLISARNGHKIGWRCFCPHIDFRQLFLAPNFEAFIQSSRFWCPIQLQVSNLFSRCKIFQGIATHLQVTADVSKSYQLYAIVGLWLFATISTNHIQSTSASDCSPWTNKVWNTTTSKPWGRKQSSSACVWEHLGIPWIWLIIHMFFCPVYPSNLPWFESWWSKGFRNFLGATLWRLAPNLDVQGNFAGAHSGAQVLYSGSQSDCLARINEKFSQQRQQGSEMEFLHSHLQQINLNGIRHLATKAEKVKTTVFRMIAVLQTQQSWTQPLYQKKKKKKETLFQTLQSDMFC